MLEANKVCVWILKSYPTMLIKYFINNTDHILLSYRIWNLIANNISST